MMVTLAERDGLVTGSGAWVFPIDTGFVSVTGHIARPTVELTLALADSDESAEPLVIELAGTSETDNRVVGTFAIPGLPETGTFEFARIEETRWDDSLAVALLAAASLLERGALDHPAGLTRKLCVEPWLLTLGAEAAAFGAEQIASAREEITSRLQLEPSSGCHDVEVGRFGASWIADADERPAVLLRLGVPVFSGLDEATVVVAAVRGGPSSAGVRCHVIRPSGKVLWSVERCESLTPLALTPIRPSQRGDTVAVTVLAAAEVLEPRALDHPTGATRRLCVEALDRMQDPESPMLNAEQLEYLGSEVVSRLQLEPSRGCGITIDVATLGFVDEEGEPCVLLELTAPVFLGANEASIVVATARGGRWGIGVRCRLAREMGSALWVVKGCETLWLN